MSFSPKGNLIAGQWCDGPRTFTSSPALGSSYEFSAGSAELVDRAAQAAEQAFQPYAHCSRQQRATFLEAIAEEIDMRGTEITAIGSQESGLPTARLEGERARTNGQLRLFASYIRKGDYLDRRHDEALPERKPLPRPDLRLIQRPIGPIAVFGASNFPLAFSVGGGDTASALAAGCPVVVKGHDAHPGTGELVADAIAAAAKRCGIHPGVFSYIHGGSRDIGTTLVRHPLIKAVGFTGSLSGGRALFDLCAARPEPIPFFGELGAVNPMFLLPEATKNRGDELGRGWAASLTMGVGQFCTNPGIAVALQDHATSVADAARQALSGVAQQIMLTHGIAQAYHARVDQIKTTKGVHEVMSSNSEAQNAAPNLFVVSGTDFLANPALSEEVFGPTGILVTASNPDEMLEIARNLEGQLAITLHLDNADTELARRLMPILERKAGRVLANNFPTGVEVSDAMVHGGPYPASTNFGATSVGTMAIRRFLRPVCFQGVPEALLPDDLRGSVHHCCIGKHRMMPGG
ncbi:aldehyde dehydrogenase (NADP(+)) [Hoeflea sp. YIM 152468]|uniref:aldehyde dehydrogenase (NADP(+)) n=1 Tax=Hoeflea sp. YIM 152468 TaxID=3031759 RepID=UPI0023DBDEAF|nr:aldehyde dehydrogenase (NADP(+)) [Hoeflea sp. YIM 152468]MDF1609066.1 aldehyde dehydrogenase (NADP(+)) [Hoeflea sp. YIM 152468]